MALMQLLIGLQKGSGALLVAVVLNIALLAGLLLRRKWAYVATLIFAMAGVIVALGRSEGTAIGVFIGNGLVVVPMIMSTRFFFPRQSENLGAGDPGPERGSQPAAADGADAAAKQ
jgi:hypothetical protein